MIEEKVKEMQTKLMKMKVVNCFLVCTSKM